MTIWGIILALMPAVDFDRDIQCRKLIDESQPWAVIEGVTTEDSVYLESYLELTAASPYHYTAHGMLYTTFHTGKNKKQFTPLKVDGTYVDLVGENSANLQAVHHESIEKIYLDFNDDLFGNGSFIRLEDGTEYVMDCGISPKR